MLVPPLATGTWLESSVAAFTVDTEVSVVVPKGEGDLMNPPVKVLAPVPPLATVVGPTPAV